MLFWSKFPNYTPLKTLVKYLTVSNIIYIIYFDIPVKEAIEKEKYNGKQLPYEDWVLYKKSKSKEYSATVGQKLTSFVNEDLGTAINLETGTIKTNDKSQWSQGLKDKLNKMVTVIFAYLLGYDITIGEDQGELNDLAEGIARKHINVKSLQDKISERAITVIDSLYGNSGYDEFKKGQKITDKDKMRRKISAYNAKYNLTRGEQDAELEKLMGLVDSDSDA